MKISILLGIMMSILVLNPTIAQDRAPSPASKTEQRVGLTDITVEYSRPGVKGRTIFAEDGLVPFGKMWRLGANSATKITFSGDVKIADQDLAAGSYAITTIPTADAWTVNFYPYEATRWTSYREATPTLSVQAATNKVANPIENFVIHFDQIRDYSANLLFGWSDVIAVVGISVK